MQNTIEREVTINASKETVYNTIANPEKVTQWFPDTIEGMYAPGENTIFVFGSHRTQVSVIDAKPNEYFAYRWIPGGSDFIGDLSTKQTTLVEFRIEDNGDGTSTIKMTESGFASLPEETIENALEKNSKGWDFMLDRLQKLFR